MRFRKGKIYQGRIIPWRPIAIFSAVVYLSTMKIFLSSVDTFLQNHVYEAFCAKDKEGTHEIIASLHNPASKNNHFERITQFISVCKCLLFSV